MSTEWEEELKACYVLAEFAVRFWEDLQVDYLVQNQATFLMFFSMAALAETTACANIAFVELGGTWLLS
jgi:hypothetical protein